MIAYLITSCAITYLITSFVITYLITSFMIAYLITSCGIVHLITSFVIAYLIISFMIAYIISSFVIQNKLFVTAYLIKSFTIAYLMDAGLIGHESMGCESLWNETVEGVLVRNMVTSFIPQPNTSVVQMPDLTIVLAVVIINYRLASSLSPGTLFSKPLFPERRWSTSLLPA